MITGTKSAIFAISLIIPLTIIFLLSSENRISSFSDTHRLRVLASFYPIYEFSRTVGGEKIEVSPIIPSGVEPHDWEPTVKDIQNIQSADLIIINGVGFEPWIDKIISTNPKILVVDTSQGIQPIKLDSDSNDNHQFDPHIWLDPVLAKTQVQHIADALSQIDVDNANYYQDNSNQFNSKLTQLDTKIRSELSSCEGKEFLAFHNSFSYFAREYGLTQNNIVGIDPNEETTSTIIEKIIQKSQLHHFKIIFNEEAINRRVSQVIADEIGAKVLILSPLEISENNSDYITGMKKNLSNLKEEICS